MMMQRMMHMMMHMVNHIIMHKMILMIMHIMMHMMVLPVGGPMSAQQANVLEPKRKKIKSRLNLQRLSRYLR